MEQQYHYEFDDYYNNPMVTESGTYGGDRTLPVHMAYNRLPLEYSGYDNIPINGVAIHGQFPFEQTEMSPELQERWDETMNSNDNRSRFIPTSNKSEYLYSGLGTGPYFNTERKLGPVTSLFLSSENIRRLGDYFASKGLGRPSPENVRELQYLILADEPDFLNDWKRDERSVSNQLKRLNSLFIQDYLPKLQSARDSWIKYQYDSYYGMGYQLIDNPENVSNKTKDKSLEFNNRFF
jgi:hypothetical protein